MLQNCRGIMVLLAPGRVFHRIDSKLCDHQAGCRQDMSCTDHIAALRIVIEQSLEWNSSFYVNFIDYEKAIDSIGRETLWELLFHYGIPKKIISVIQCSYQGMPCRVVHRGQPSDHFDAKTGVRQGCLLSPFIFTFAVDLIMRTSTEGRRNGIQWTLWSQLDGLDFADELALLSYSHAQMQNKTTLRDSTSAKT